jgi:hypothetical protein
MHPRPSARTGNATWAPTPAAILLVTALLATAGCDAVLTTTELPQVREDGILGGWKDLGTPGSPPDSDLLLIRFTDGQYRAGSADQFAQGKASPFTLARVGNALIAQMPSESQCDEFGTPKGGPCWSLNRVELSGDRMNWYDFDAQRLGRDSYNGVLNVAHSVHRERKKDGSFDNAILFSADSPDLQRFLESYVKRRGVFRLSGRYRRVR